MAITVDEFLAKFVESMQPVWIRAGNALVEGLKEHTSTAAYVDDSQVVHVHLNIPLIELGAIALSLSHQIGNKTHER